MVQIRTEGTQFYKVPVFISILGRHGESGGEYDNMHLLVGIGELVGRTTVCGLPGSAGEWCSLLGLRPSQVGTLPCRLAFSASGGEWCTCLIELQVGSMLYQCAIFGGSGGIRYCVKPMGVENLIEDWVEYACIYDILQLQEHGKFCRKIKSILHKLI